MFLCHVTNPGDPTADTLAQWLRDYGGPAARFFGVEGFEPAREHHMPDDLAALEANGPELPVRNPPKRMETSALTQSATPDLRYSSTPRPDSPRAIQDAINAKARAARKRAADLRRQNGEPRKRGPRPRGA